MCSLFFSPIKKMQMFSRKRVCLKISADISVLTDIFKISAYNNRYEPIYLRYLQGPTLIPISINLSDRSRPILVCIGQYESASTDIFNHGCDTISRPTNQFIPKAQAVTERHPAKSHQHGRCQTHPNMSEI